MNFKQNAVFLTVQNFNNVGLRTNVLLLRRAAVIFIVVLNKIRTKKTAILFYDLEGQIRTMKNDETVTFGRDDGKTNLI